MHGSLSEMSIVQVAKLHMSSRANPPVIDQTAYGRSVTAWSPVCCYCGIISRLADQAKILWRLKSAYVV